MVQAKPEGYPVLIPYLIVRGAAEAIAFCKSVFNAKERLRLPGPNGRIGHAELEFGDSLIMLADDSPEHHAVAPGPGDQRSVTMHLYVTDVDAVVERAEAAGARLRDPIENKFYGDRMGTIVDPFGHVWHVSTHVEDVSEDELKRRVAAMVGDRKP